MSNKSLKCLPDGFDQIIYSFPSLIFLFLFDNQLTSLPVGFGQNLPNLEELLLYNNKLKSLPDGFGQNLPSLTSLDLHYNQLTSLPAGFGRVLSNLKVLSLNNNQLTNLPDGFGQNLPSLKKLYIHNNQLKNLPDSFGQNLPKLKYCNILNNYNNEVKVIPQIKETLFNRNMLINKLQYDVWLFTHRVLYKKVLKIISTELVNYNARIYTKHAYKPPYGLVPNRLMREDLM